jgi:hypothetical protein
MVKFWVSINAFDEGSADLSLLVLELDFSANFSLALSERRAPDRSATEVGRDFVPNQSTTNLPRLRLHPNDYLTWLLNVLAMI